MSILSNYSSDNNISVYELCLSHGKGPAGVA